MSVPHEFTLSGGHPVLDFVNTVDDWTAAAPRDYLVDFDDARRFAEAAGLITRRESLFLAGARPHRAVRPKGDERLEGARRLIRPATELVALRRLRASLQRVLRASVKGERAPSSDIAVLQTSLVAATRGTELVAGADRPLARLVGVEANGAAAVRYRIVERAVALLLSDAMPRVKACPSCGWFFLDVSKNQSRVWCSMDACGARAKASRYYRRTRRRLGTRSGPTHR